MLSLSRKIALVLVAFMGLSISTGSAHAANMNFRFSPLSLLIGGIDVNLDYAVTDHWVVGPGLSYLDLRINDLSAKVNKLGGEATYSFDGNFADGWYTGLGLSLTTVDLSLKRASSGDTLTANGNGTVLYARGGYQWFWQSFNINLGGVISHMPNAKVEVKDQNGVVTDSYTAGTGLGLEFKMGFTF